MIMHYVNIVAINLANFFNSDLFELLWLIVEWFLLP